MTLERVQRAAELRGICFNGERKWLNTMVGYGYEFFTPSGYGFYQTPTLNGAYKEIIKYRRIA